MTPTVEHDLAPPLSEAVRAASASAHEDAETSPYVLALMAGDQRVEAYARLVAQHHAIYEALEGSLETMASLPDIGGFVDPALARVPALEADLHALLGPSWRRRREAVVLPATAAYAARIRDVAERWPAGWLAHHYVRYLGDLSGGLFIRRRLEETYGIDASCGTAFYDFPGIPSPKAWKDAYRRRLDALPWGPDERARFTAEVLEGYRCNTAVFQALGA